MTLGEKAIWGMPLWHIGDNARALIALGDTEATGNVFQKNRRVFHTGHCCCKEIA